MKRFELCIIKEHVKQDLIGSFAFILDDFGDCYHVEIWNFELFKGAEIDSLPKNYLRPATDEEQKIYLEKFNQYFDGY